MKAIRVQHTGGPEVMELVDVPTPQAKAVKAGDRVAWSGTLGSYAEYVAAPEEHLVPVPSSISDEQATAAMVHGLTAHYLVNDAHQLKAGETALVHAAAGG